MRTRNFEQPEFLFGEDSDGMIAMLWNGTYSFSGINTSARFSTPIIIKAAGEYSCAVKPHIRAGGNRQSGIQETVIASLLA